MIQGLATELVGADCTALLIVAGSSSDPDIASFVDGSRLHESFVIATADGQARLGYLSAHEHGEAEACGLETLSPEALELDSLKRLSSHGGDFWASVLATGLELSGVEKGRIAVAGRFENGSLFEALSMLSQRGFTFLGGHEMMLRLRRAKSERQVAEIRRVAAATAATLRRVAAILRHCQSRDTELWFDGSRLRTGDLRREIALSLSAHGLEQPDGNIIAVAGEGGVPHNTGDDARRIETNESIVVDLFPRGSLFADCTRTFCVGDPPAELQRAHDLVRTALAWARDNASVDTLGSDLQAGVCEQFAAAGHATPKQRRGGLDGYLHGLGHGVGYEIHEYPLFHDEHGETGVLRVGDVFTLEPALYYPQLEFAVRLEDLFHLGADGLENLTPLPYDLDPAAWAD